MAAPAANPDHKAVWSDPYLDAAQHGLVVTSSAPVFDATGKFRGVIAMDVQLKSITDLVSNYSLGQTGYAFLIDKNKRLIALSAAGYKDWGVTSQSLPEGQVLVPSLLSKQLSDKFLQPLNRNEHGTNRARINLDSRRRALCGFPTHPGGRV